MRACLARDGLLISLVVGLAAACGDAEVVPPYVEPPRDDVVVPPGGTIVSLTFDDGFATHMEGAEILDAHGLHGTFYVILARLGREGYLTVPHLQSLADRGHEIGGHTFTHRRLTELPLDEASRELCDVRVALAELGFRADSFAYPFGGSSPDLERIASECQYSSARGVGGLRHPETCVDCPLQETIIPQRSFEILTPPAVIPSTTLETIQQYVMNAENNGGGWVPLVFHNVCDGCAENAVSPAVLNELAGWLASRVDRGTLVATVDQVIVGEARPSVAGPPPTRVPDGDQLLANPSLERWATPDGAPDCWRFGASNDEQWARSSEAFDGTYAQYVAASIEPVKARLVSGQDMGTCAIPAIPGQRFQMAARYKGSANALPIAYYRTRLGDWATWTHGSGSGAVSDWTELSWTTPGAPSDATAVSFGLALTASGDGLMDAFRVTTR